MLGHSVRPTWAWDRMSHVTYVIGSRLLDGLLVSLGWLLNGKGGSKQGGLASLSVH